MPSPVPRGTGADIPRARTEQGLERINEMRPPDRRHSKGQLTAASKLAMGKGSQRHPRRIGRAGRVPCLRSGPRCGPDHGSTSPLDIRDMVLRLDAEPISVPIVACGISNDARAAVAAIRAGARNYIPLPPDPELIAAVLARSPTDARELVYRDGPWSMWSSSPSRSRRARLGAITGESGTGKEGGRHAATSTNRSHRARRPFHLGQLSPRSRRNFAE